MDPYSYRRLSGCSARSGRVSDAIRALWYRAGRFAGAFTSVLCHWRSAHPTLDESRVRSLELGEPGFRTSACWAGTRQHTQWPQGAHALPREKNGWAYIYSTLCLAHGLLDAGAYEEALVLMQHAVAQARTCPPT